MLLQKSGFSSGPNQWAALIFYRRLFDIPVLLVNPLIILILFLKRTMINKTDVADELSELLKITNSVFFEAILLPFWLRSI